MLHYLCYIIFATLFVLHYFCYINCATLFLLHYLCYIICATLFALHYLCYIICATLFLLHYLCYIIFSTLFVLHYFCCIICATLFTPHFANRAIKSGQGCHKSIYNECEWSGVAYLLETRCAVCLSVAHNNAAHYVQLRADKRKGNSLLFLSYECAFTCHLNCRLSRDSDRHLLMLM